MAIIGVYKIESKIKPNRVYIGSSIDIRSRKATHFNSLKNKKHPNRKLQNHCNKYGLKDFIFTIITTCDAETLIEKEQYFIDVYNPYFNLRPNADNNCGVICSEEKKEKLRKANLGKKHREESKQKCRNYKHTEEARQKISDALRKRTPTEKMIQKLKERKSVKVIDISTGIIYDSIIMAANSIGMKRRTLENMLHGTNGVANVRNKTNFRFYKVQSVA